MANEFFTPREHLDGELNIGVSVNGELRKDYSLLRSNGIAERVFTDKAPQKTYSWMCNVFSVALNTLGGVPIGGNARAEYAKSESITVPKVIMDLPLADANTLLVEIHRKVWKNLLRNQEVLCKYCGEKMVIDIDLNRIKMLDEDIPKLGKDWTVLNVRLPEGWIFEGLQVMGRGDSESERAYSEFIGMTFNLFEFRCPTMADVVRNERYAADEIMFWRRIAFDCLERIVSESSSGANQTELPITIKNVLGLKIFNEILLSSDLEKIRHALREEPPTLPFHYHEQCANPVCRRETPVSMEASSFFGA